MKAWILSDRNFYEPYESLVFANTISEAKKEYQNYDKMYQCDFIDLEWIDIRCIRAKEFDNMENSSEKEIVLKLVKDYNWRFEIGCDIYNEDNIKELEKILNE